MAMNIGRMFFGGLTFGEDRKATFNGIVFEINSEGTHFNDNDKKSFKRLVFINKHLLMIF